MPVDIDPLRQVLSNVSETQHLSGNDNGRRLTDNIMRDLNLLGLEAASPSGKETGSNGPKTLGDLPFALMHLEMDEAGIPVQASTGSPAHDWVSHKGYLAEYFTNETETPEWRHASNPPCFQEDFPFSVDNINCDQIAADTLDLFDPSKDVIRCSAMWAGAISRKVHDDHLEDSKELYRQRILGVSDMLRFLGCVRQMMRHPLGQASHPAVYFLVTVSYSVKARPPLEPETVDIVKRLHTRTGRQTTSPEPTVLAFKQGPKVDLENWSSMTPSQRMEAYKLFVPQNWTGNRNPEVIDWPFADSDDELSSSDLDGFSDDFLSEDEIEVEVEMETEPEVTVEEPATPPAP